MRKASHKFEAERHEAKKKKDTGGRNCEQHPNHSYPKPLPVQSAVWSAHQELGSTATNQHARTDLLKILVCEESAIIIIIIS